MCIAKCKWAIMLAPDSVLVFYVWSPIVVITIVRSAYMAVYVCVTNTVSQSPR